MMNASLRLSLLLTFLAVAALGLTVDACTCGSDSGPAQVALPPPPPPPPPPDLQNQAQLPPAPPTAPRELTAEERAMFLQVPTNAVSFANLSTGAHHFILFEREGSTGTKKAPTPPVVRLKEGVAMKIALNFNGRNHFLFHLSPPPVKDWARFTNLVVVLRGGDEVEAAIRACAIADNARYCAGHTRPPLVDKLWSKVEFPLAEFVSESKAAMPVTSEVETVTFELYRDDFDKPNAPVNKVIYVGAVYLAP